MQPPLGEQMWTFFWSAFHFEGLEWPLAVAGIALALAFGAIWLLMYRPASTPGSPWLPSRALVPC